MDNGAARLRLGIDGAIYALEQIKRRAAMRPHHRQDERQSVS